MRPAAAEPAHQRSAEPAQDQAGARTGADRAQASAAAQEGQKAQAASKESEANPDIMNSESGRLTVAGPRQALVEQAEAKARKARPLPKRRSSADTLFGYGSMGTTANGINLNLAPRTAVAAIGTDQLARERQVDGERRKSAHLGSWHPMDPSRWKSAIENYTPSVQLGNQTALNTAASAFGSYLSMIHNRIHPLFADSFLGSLDNLPSSHPMNNPDLSTEIEYWDARDGGSWRYTASRGTDFETAFRGCFHTVGTDRIVQTFTWEGMPEGVALETLTVTDVGDGWTRLHAVSLTDSFEGRDAWLASGMEIGINDGYAKLDELLAHDAH